MIERALALYLRHANREVMRLDPAPADFRLPAPDAGRRYLLYVHVPFCPVLCPFCSFHRVEFRNAKAQRYFAALRTQLRHYADSGFRLSGVYVGGGTPTVAPEELGQTLALVRELFGPQPVSVETNPSDLTPPVASLLRESGVTRLSVGVQSFDDGLLRSMERYAKYGSSAEIRERIASLAGYFPTLNVDMIFNLPGQTRAMLERDLEILADELRVDQVSFYPLMVADSTRLAMRERMGGYGADREPEYYRLIRGRLARDYRTSSAWCFSRGAGMADEYIVTDDEYIGAGSGAFGYLGGVLYSNTFSLNRYAQLAGRGDSPVAMYRRMSEIDRMRYDFLTGLFGLRLEKAAVERKYAGRFARRLWKELAFFRAAGALRDTGTHYELTERGTYYWVVMMREFFTGVNRFREQLRLHIRQEFDSQRALGRRARAPASDPGGPVRA